MLATTLTLLTALIAAALLSFAPGALLALVLVLFLVWLGITRVGRQTWSVAQVGIMTVPQRLGSSLVIVIGIAGVVGVLIAVLAMAQGLQAMLKETGSNDTAITMRAGAQTELNSVLDHDAIALIGQMP